MAVLDEWFRDSWIDTQLVQYWSRYYWLCGESQRKTLISPSWILFDDKKKMHENTLSSSFSGHNSLEKALFNVVDSPSPHGCPRRYRPWASPTACHFYLMNVLVYIFSVFRAWCWRTQEESLVCRLGFFNFDIGILYIDGKVKGPLQKPNCL